MDAVIEDLVSKGTIPGAVLLVGQKGKVIYRKNGQIDPLEVKKVIANRLGRTY